MKMFAIVKKGTKLDNIRGFYNLYITRKSAERDLEDREFDFDFYNLSDEEEDMDAKDLFEVQEIDIADDDLAEVFDNLWEVERIDVELAMNKLWRYLKPSIKNEFLKTFNWRSINNLG